MINSLSSPILSSLILEFNPLCLTLLLTYLKVYLSLRAFVYTKYRYSYSLSTLKAGGVRNPNPFPSLPANIHYLVRGLCISRAA